MTESAPVTMSQRQEQILRLLLTKPQADIARELGLSRKTVHAHVARAAEKFGINALSGDGRVELQRVSRAYFQLTEKPGDPPPSGTCTPVSAAAAPAFSSDNPETR
jgi:biotin operon repressor